ncbi:MAG: hypothetical protein ACM3VV_05805 [Deltaproteobacteria bacterium]
MSSRNSNIESSDNRTKKKESLESIEENQDNVEAAESDPLTSGPAENTRAEVAEEMDKSD